MSRIGVDNSWTPLRCEAGSQLVLADPVILPFAKKTDPKARHREKNMESVNASDKIPNLHHSFFDPRTDTPRTYL